MIKQKFLGLSRQAPELVGAKCQEHPGCGKELRKEGKVREEAETSPTRPKRHSLVIPKPDSQRREPCAQML